MSVRPSVRMEQLAFHWADINEVWHFKLLKKTGENSNFIKI
jgi:hypothetical protein